MISEMRGVVPRTDISDAVIRGWTVKRIDVVQYLSRGVKGET